MFFCMKNFYVCVTREYFSFTHAHGKFLSENLSPGRAVLPSVNIKYREMEFLLVAVSLPICVHTTFQLQTLGRRRRKEDDNIKIN